MLTEFNHPEVVHAVTCDACNTQHPHSREIQLYALPEVVLIHVGRIMWQGVQRQKIQTHVSFPLGNLDLSPYLSNHYQRAPADDPDLYDLVSVVEHHGRFFGSGHYTTFCYTPETQSWLR